jgi:hypothetical protein
MAMPEGKLFRDQALEKLGAPSDKTADDEGTHDFGGLLRSHTGTMNRAKKTTLKTKAK